jgi:hypothetical protein
MIDMEDNIYKNKFAVRCALGMIKILRKLEKNIESEKVKFEPEMALYMDSKEYIELQDEIKKKDDEDETRMDTDPKGFELFSKAVRITYHLI